VEKANRSNSASVLGFYATGLVNFPYFVIMLPLMEIQDFWGPSIWVVLLGVLLLLGGWFFRAILKQSHASNNDWKAQFDIIEYFSQSVFRQNTTEDILWDIASSCIEKMGLEDCVIYLKDDTRNVWVQKAAYGPKNVDYRAIHEPIELGLGQGIVGRVGRSGVAEIIDDISQDPDYVVDDAIRGSEMAVPIYCDKQVIGVIDSEHSLQGFFTPSHLRIMQNVANICGQKIGRSLGEQRVEEFAKFFELNPNPVARVKLDGTVLLANAAATRVFGPACQDGRSLPPRHALWELIKGLEKEGSSNQHQLQLADSWQQMTFTKPEGAEHVEVYAVDVTEVQEARTRAAQAERHKSDFLSVMSHEIRTPLNAILGLIELLMREGNSKEGHMSHLAYMEFAGKHLQGLLTDVLDLERLDSGNAEPYRTPFETRDLFKRVVNGFVNRATSTENELVLKVEDDVPDVLIGDVGWVTQMLNNLIANALKFTSQGRVACGVAWEGGALVMRVVDTGKGIALEDMERILKPFEQAQGREINVSNDGVGLGLAITKRLIDLHGGTLNVESEVGQGTSFTISLPLEVGSDKETPTNERAQAGAFVIPAAPVLIVDDNELNVLVAQRMVANWGYEVVTASNVDEAEALLVSEKPFLVLLDIHMPGRDGFQAAQDWRGRRGEFEELGIVGLTADAEIRTKEKALASGMDNVVVKPFNPPHLRSVIDQFASQRIA
jgi:signal transduction histidine kinase/ActR/RegA family two-component response regulator